MLYCTSLYCLFRQQSLDLIHLLRDTSGYIETATVKIVELAEFILEGGSMPVQCQKATERIEILQREWAGRVRFH